MLSKAQTIGQLEKEDYQLILNVIYNSVTIKGLELEQAVKTIGKVQSLLKSLTK